MRASLYAQSPSKIISKILVTRLKGLMPKLVSQEQTSFIPGRHMSENILIAQETLHSFHNKRGKTSFMAIKVDLEKAYDRLCWDFIGNTLREVGIPDMTLNLILQSIRTTSMNVLWNGATTTPFYPQRGVRQGDPLSPYLFVLCLERLSHKISQLVQDGLWKPMKFTRGGPTVSHLFFADDMLLFAEASEEQARVIKSVLQEFCELSGQKVSDSKTRVLFSQNVNSVHQNVISRIMGFTKTADLGKYLGMPLVQGRVTRRTYEDLLKKVEKRISGWKADKLSLAGRVTLAKSVLSAIPSFAMQTTRIPSGLCDAMDKKIRQFIWDSTSDSRKIHLISWSKICLPKEAGGLGFRSLRQQNNAYLMKLAWAVMTCPDALWVRILRSKYGKSPWSNSDIRVRGSLSYQWRSIISVWKETELGMKWRLGNGSIASFWHDSWLDIGIPLSHLVPDLELGENNDATVSHYVSDSGNWLWSSMPQLPSEIYMHIAATKAPSPQGPQDQLVWGHTISGIFTLSSAINSMSPSHDNVESLWKIIWRWKGPQRIRSFLWLCGHNALITNERRARMGISNDLFCPRCSANCEATLHAIRDCFYIKNVWKQLVAPREWGRFFELNLTDWILFALSTNLGLYSFEDWQLSFGITVWMSWKWRNAIVFDVHERLIHAPLYVINHFKQDVHVAEQMRLALTVNGCKGGDLIGWQLPEHDWVKVNSDGASCHVSQVAAAGGVIRDHIGNWIKGYVHKIGYCSATLAELWGAFDGLELAWQLGYRKVILEMDALLLVQMLQSSEASCPYAGLEVLLKAILDMKQRDWEVRVCHTLREGNKCADWLAKHAFHYHLGLYHLDEPPQLLKAILFSDVLGIRWPRGA